MAGSVNKVTLVGRVGADPEVKGRDGGFVTFSLATSESWKDNSGQRQERTQWHKIVVYNTAAVNFAKQYVNKGDLLYIEGTLETRKWTKEDGSDAYITEVVIRPFTGVLTSLQSGSREDREERTESRSNNRDSGRNNQREQERQQFSRDLDDDIPF